jgi:hypothetical protein
MGTFMDNNSADTARLLPTSPRIEAGVDHFQASVKVRLPDGKPQRWHIREDSRVWPDH